MLSHLQQVPQLRNRQLYGRLVSLRVVAIRLASHGVRPARPKPAKIQFQKPANVKGHLKYERYYCRDPTYTDPVIPGDTFFRAVTRRVGWHHIEVFPVIFLVAAWHVVFFITAIWSAGKIECWLDRSKRDPPWDWTRCRDNYWKQPTLLYDPDGLTHQRLPPEYEQLQDELIEAAKQRGTR